MTPILSSVGVGINTKKLNYRINLIFQFGFFNFSMFRFVSDLKKKIGISVRFRLLNYVIQFFDLNGNR